MKNIYLVLAAFIVILNSCDKDDPLNKFKINENIKVVISDWGGPHRGANIPCAVWNKNNALITVFPLATFQLNERFNVVEEKIHEPDGGVMMSKYIRSAWEDNQYLIIKSNWGDVSCGSLRLFNSELNTQEEILDSTYNISSAVPYRNSDQLIYYSYGKPLGINPGYYLLDRKTGEKTLLLNHISDIGPGEYINGFDVHPTQDILLVPFVKEAKSPKVVEYNFKEKTSDTLNISFDLSFNRICLWLRYNKSGERILYSCYPRSAGGDATNDGSEIGIINRSLDKKTILDVNTNPVSGMSVNICPNWSPDEQHIIYSSAPVTAKEGAKGLYLVYMYKNIPQE